MEGICVCTDERCTRPEHTKASRITDQGVERAAILLWVEEMAHYPDDHRSVAAARRRWDSTTESVRESWRRKARRVVSAALSETRMSAAA